MSSTICSEKIHRPQRSLESSNQERGGVRGWLPRLDGTHPPLQRRRGGVAAETWQCPRMCSRFHWLLLGYIFFKYSCLISACVTCPVQCAADALRQCRAASGQHGGRRATWWIINGLNQHLWCGWQRAGAGRLPRGAAGPAPRWPTPETVTRLKTHSRICRCMYIYIDTLFFLWRTNNIQNNLSTCKKMSRRLTLHYISHIIITLILHFEAELYPFFFSTRFVMYYLDN